MRLSGMRPSLFLLYATFASFTAMAAEKFVVKDAKILRSIGSNLAYRLEPAYANLTFQSPVLVTPAPGVVDRLYVLEQSGRIQEIATNQTPARKSLFLDLTAVADGEAGGERGLLGLAFSPRYTTDKLIFAAFTVKRTNALEIHRIVRTDAARFTNELVLRVEKTTPSNGNHNGGMIAFGPDGFLYIGTGDGGGADDRDGNSQRKDRLLGKILRINPFEKSGTLPYAIPADNPFRGNGRGFREEIYAYGLRNPWRFSFDAVTGNLWVGDVGQNTWEEINLVKRGGNYGWNVMEGVDRFANGTAPVAGETYLPPLDRLGRDLAQSITGGHVYRGTRIPALVGSYVFGDYVSRSIWALTLDAAGRPTRRLIAALDGDFISAFGLDLDGEILVIGHTRGKLHRLRPANPAAVIELPKNLSETGLFAGAVGDLKPVAGLNPFVVRAPLWSDGAEKIRWFGLLLDGQAIYRKNAPWDFPVGALFVKHFEVPLAAGRTRKLETRLLVLHDEGWRGYTYRWNAAQTDALRLDDGLIENIERLTPEGRIVKQSWQYPSTSQCLQCHNGSQGYALGFRGEQFNPTFLTALKDDGFFANPEELDPAAPRFYASTSDSSRSLQDRARSYLASNCVHCHSAQGPAPGAFDLGFHVPLAEAQLLNVTPSQGSFGIDDALRIAPGDPDKSVLAYRMGARGPDARMPRVASSVVVAEALELIGKWIRELR